MTTCNQCGAIANVRCGDCRSAHYCSKTCQKDHWPNHRDICKHEQLKKEIQKQKQAIAIPDKVMRDIEDLANFCALDKIRAEDANECYCSKCAALCLHIPGMYDPFHVLQLVQKNADFYATCVQDFFFGKEKKPCFFLRPPNQNEQKGTRVHFLTKKGPCSHLGPHGCTLKRDDMPIGCVVAKACEDNSPSVGNSESPIIWGTRTGLRVMKQFETYHQTRQLGASFGNDDKFQQEILLSSFLFALPH